MKRSLQIFPHLKKVTGEHFQREHWRILFSKLGLDAPSFAVAGSGSNSNSGGPAPLSLETLTLRHFLSVPDALVSKSKEIADLAARALGEVTIREAVDELKTWASQTEFARKQHTCSGGGAGGGKTTTTTLIKDWKDLFTKISDQLALVSSLKESPFFAPFEDTCRQFEQRLTVLNGVLGSLNQIQRKWVYLEPIFARGALPQEQARFVSLLCCVCVCVSINRSCLASVSFLFFPLRFFLFFLPCLC